MSNNVIIEDGAIVGNNVFLGHNVIIESNCSIGENSYIGDNTIIRFGTTLGENANIGSNCIIGEYQMDFYRDHKRHEHKLIIGDNALIRSGTIIYNGSAIGNNFQTGHQVNVRENSKIGNNVSLGTLSDIQGYCTIGNYVRAHSNVHIGQKTVIEDYVWIFPYVVFTNDPTPPSEVMLGVHVHSFAIIATGSVLLPGVNVGQDSLIGAHSNVTRNVPPYAVVVGNPGKVISDVRKITNKTTGEHVYPWREHFDRAMPWENIGFDKWYQNLNLNDKFDFIKGDCYEEH